MNMAIISRNLKPMYFANIIWAIFCAMCKHFNKCLAVSGFEETGLVNGIVWPYLDLHNFVNMMASNQNIELCTLPQE